jgi:uncharacterized membrane protein
MHFEIAVTLPEDSSPISIKGFETDVPNTSQHLTALASKVDFGFLSLHGTNAPIFVEVSSYLLLALEHPHLNILISID